MDEISIKVDLSQVEALSRQYPGISVKARTSRITEALALLEREIKKDTPWGAGPIHLRDSIFSEVRHEGHKVAGIVGTPLEHGQPVEHGTKPHFPPIAPLTFWVEKKLGLYGKEAKSVAFAIAQTIAKRGTEGHKMFSDNFDENRDRVTAILAQIGDDIVRMTRGAS